ncbi:D-isomer specific 2-hydroxyacid dehydrogenase family protein [Gulosibacter bifidus]|uniref:D-isomer specific 2-hydroxyacid dehydrogenase family protein n=1 Tax=Gulosibacter bifidus TaxID=272239 RepID=A0ABW5RGC9_9MICO|nr:D-isomer specific 2-hydroxyacid dehydrogenase family protein [Gulosibacter bifidus]
MTAASTPVPSPFGHHEVLSQAPVAIPADQRPEIGAISILPVNSIQPRYAEVVAEAGGDVAPLSTATRAVIHTSYRDVDTLINALEQYPEIGWVQLPYAGIDAFAERLRPHAERGVLFTSGKGAYAQPVAEHALMLTLALQRQLPVRLRATSWGTSSGLSLFGANIVIVGAGGIARELIRLLEPFGVSVTVVRRSLGAVAGADHTVQFGEMDAVLPDADVVVLAAAATPETCGMIGTEQLRLMREDAVLVNIGRGPLVDTDALVAALEAGEIYGAGLDVTNPEPLPDGHPLWSNDRCIITPHTADTPEMVLPLILRRVHDNVRAYVDHGRFVGIADPLIGY